MVHPAAERVKMGGKGKVGLGDETAWMVVLLQTDGIYMLFVGAGGVAHIVHRLHEKMLRNLNQAAYGYGHGEPAGA